MKITIYRGTKEIGGTLIEIKSGNSRILIDAGYPLFLKGLPMQREVSEFGTEKLLELGVLPKIDGLYKWDKASFDAVIISHAHIDHYGLLKYINPAIPVYMSKGTKKLIEVSQLFGIAGKFTLDIREFNMYRQFSVGDFTVKPYLMDHSAFDAAAFEISSEGKTIIYTGDFRGHGRKSVCLDMFIEKAALECDVLLSEGTMFGRLEEKILTEQDLEQNVVDELAGKDIPMLFQCSSQNIDRLVSFYKAALQLKRTFVIDIYTANVLFELKQLGNNLPYPSKEYSNIRVFYPFRITQKLFKEIGENYARKFSKFHISKNEIEKKQNRIVMAVRPSMLNDLRHCGFSKGLFLYSLWEGYRDSDYQRKFEEFLQQSGFRQKSIHTSGHASIEDIKRVIDGLKPKRVIPIHTLNPELFEGLSSEVELHDDGVGFEI